MKRFLISIIVIFVACSDKPEQKPQYDTIQLSVILANDFFKQPLCSLLDNQGQLLNPTEPFEPGIVTLNLPKDSVTFGVRCVEQTEAIGELSFHTLFTKVISANPIVVKLNPITELAYRLSQHDQANFSRFYYRILDAFNIDIEPLDVMADLSSNNAMAQHAIIINLLKSMSGVDEALIKTHVIKLKGWITDAETIIQKKGSLASTFESSIVIDFLTTNTIDPNVKVWFDDTFNYQKEQASFLFNQLYVLRYMNDNTYLQTPVGGSGEGIISYKSSDKTIADIDKAGLVTFKQPGNITITANKASDDNYLLSEANYQLTIKKNMLEQVAVSFSENKVTVDFSDETYQQTFTGGSGTGLVYYQSSDERIATVDPQGQVTLKRLGIVTITGIKGADEDYHRALDSYTLTINGIALHTYAGQIQPVKDMQAAVQLAKPGDRFVLAGDFHFEPALEFSGIKGENIRPIVIESHAVLPHRISGTKSVYQLTNNKWSIWQSGPPSCNGRCYQIQLASPVLGLFHDDTRQRVARWPNFLVGHPADTQSDMSHDNNDLTHSWWDEEMWALVKTISTKTDTVETLTTITQINITNDSEKNDLTAIPDLTGGRLLLKRDEAYHDIEIVKHNPGSNEIAIMYDPSLHEQLAQPHRFIIEHKHALDTPKEYYYDKDLETLWFWPEGDVHPSDINLSIKNQEYAFDLSGSEHIKLKNLNFFATSIRCTDCRHLQVDNSLFLETDNARQLISKAYSVKRIPITFFDNSLYLPSYPAIRHQPWTNEANQIVTPFTQGVWLPLQGNHKKTVIPLSPEQASGSITFRWLSTDEAIPQRVRVGTSLDNMRIVCDGDSVIRGAINQCVVTDLVESIGYYWQVISEIEGEYFFSSVWRYQ